MRLNEIEMIALKAGEVVSENYRLDPGLEFSLVVTVQNSGSSAVRFDGQRIWMEVSGPDLATLTSPDGKFNGIKIGAWILEVDLWSAHRRARRDEQHHGT